MKQTLLIYGCLLGLLLATSVQAQTPANRSRLELGRKTPPATQVTTSRRYSFLQRPDVTSLDRPLALQPKANLNEYFRSLLLAPAATAKVASRPTVADTPTTAPATEVRPATEENLKADNRLFSSERLIVSNVYPNPASEAAYIDYQLAAGVNEPKVILLNVLGTPVAEYTLERGTNTLRIPTQTMATNVYFYSLSVDGQMVATKKLLVRHQ